MLAASQDRVVRDLCADIQHAHAQLRYARRDGSAAVIQKWINIRDQKLDRLWEKLKEREGAS